MNCRAFFTILFTLIPFSAAIAEPIYPHPKPNGQGTVSVESVISFGKDDEPSQQELNDYEAISKIYALTPIYPMRSLCLNHDGVVKFILEIFPDGSVGDINFVDVPYGTLATFVRDEVKKW